MYICRNDFCAVIVANRAYTPWLFSLIAVKTRKNLDRKLIENFQNKRIDRPLKGDTISDKPGGHLPLVLLLPGR